jgi:hypothetical protein
MPEGIKNACPVTSIYSDTLLIIDNFFNCVFLNVKYSPEIYITFNSHGICFDIFVHVEVTRF